MSPEQLQGEQAEPRSDIFSLGVLLYQISTGQLPFRETVPSRLTDAILHQVPVSARALNPRISAELERMIVKCLEKQPEHRYQSAKEILAESTEPVVDAERRICSCCGRGQTTTVENSLDCRRRRRLAAGSALCVSPEIWRCHWVMQLRRQSAPWRFCRSRISRAIPIRIISRMA